MERISIRGALSTPIRISTAYLINAASLERENALIDHDVSVLVGGAEQSRVAVHPHGDRQRIAWDDGLGETALHALEAAQYVY